MPRGRPISDKSRQKVLNVLKLVHPEAMSINGIRMVTMVHNYTIHKLMEEFINNKWVEEIKLRKGSTKAVYRWNMGS